jgi:hypothetical protein
MLYMQGPAIDGNVRARVELYGSLLRPTSDATAVWIRNGETVLIDGPFTETDDRVVGYDPRSHESLDEALVGGATPHRDVGVDRGAFSSTHPLAPRSDRAPTTRWSTMPVRVPEDADLRRRPLEVDAASAQDPRWRASGRGVRRCAKMDHDVF